MKPTQGEMMNPQEAQTGQPDYIDKTAETVGTPRLQSFDAPAYEAMNPRYWEYR